MPSYEPSSLQLKGMPWLVRDAHTHVPSALTMLQPLQLCRALRALFAHLSQASPRDPLPGAHHAPVEGAPGEQWVPGVDGGGRQWRVRVRNSAGCEKVFWSVENKSLFFIFFFFF